MGGLLLIIAILAVIGVAIAVSRRNAAQRRELELAPVRTLAFEDVTKLGEELQQLDADLAGEPLDEGARADYQRALDVYDDAKRAGDSMTSPEDIKHVTSVVDDGRYAIACVRARVAGRELPVRRPPCFFDPRHGLSVADVEWAPPGGVPRDVPACALDAERVAAGAEPDTRQVMVGSKRVPYYEGGRAFEPYAAGYFATYAAMNWMMMGLMMGSLGAFDGSDASGELGGGDYGDGGGDYGGGDGGGFDFGDFGF
ncbi:membrane protein [Nocardioides insulae]|uniref:membrane protein n=1 Tax=Nocardioides insulae TaxID=394734 RepID=UPI00041B9B88|nr:membrane protein [Nocardioides insulae]